MNDTIEDANELLRAAVKIRRENQAAGKPHEDWYSVPQGETDPRYFITSTKETKPLPEKTLAEVHYHHGSHPTSQAFFELCDRIKGMHASKSRDYGCPSGTDPLANIRNGAKFVGIPAWRAAMVRLSDKVTRLATFNATGRLEFEGVEDTLLDLASYALLSLVLYREEHDAKSTHE
jgi:hypothetical protein